MFKDIGTGDASQTVKSDAPRERWAGNMSKRALRDTRRGK